MSPYLINLSQFKISSLLFFTLVGFFAFSTLITWLGKKSRLRLQFFLDNMIFFIIGGLIVGRIFVLVANYQVFFNSFDLNSLYKAIAFWSDKEISIIGFLIGVFIVLKRQTFLHQELFNRWADVFAISSLGLLSFFNIGTFLYGSNYGRITESFLGVMVNSPIVKYTLPIYPTQLFAALYSLIIGIYAYKLYKKYRHKYDGYVYLQVCFLFFSCRFLESFFRGDDTIYVWILRMPGILSAILAYIFFKQILKFEKKYKIS